MRRPAGNHRTANATGVTVADLEVSPSGRKRRSLPSPRFSRPERAPRQACAGRGIRSDLERYADRFAGFCEAAAPYGLTADLEFMPWTSVPDRRLPDELSTRCTGKSGVLVDALHDRSQSAIGDIATIPAGKLTIGSMRRPGRTADVTEEMMHVARNERMFPGRAVRSRLAGASHAADIVVSLEVPTVT